MQRIALIFTSAFFLCATLFSQTSDAWQVSFDKGIADIQAGRHAEGIEAFKKCLELQPDHATCAYNIACGYSLKNELDPGFEWLGKALA